MLQKTFLFLLKQYPRGIDWAEYGLYRGRSYHEPMIAKRSYRFYRNEIRLLL